MREHFEVVTQEPRVVVQAQSPVGVNGNVVPGGNDPARFFFRAVPLWRDVGIGSGENDQCFEWPAHEGTRMGIGACEMTDQRAHGAGSAIEHEGKMRGDESIRHRARHNRGERVLLDKCEQGRKVILGKGARCVHDDGQ